MDLYIIASLFIACKLGEVCICLKMSCFDFSLSGETNGGEGYVAE